MTQHKNKGPTYSAVIVSGAGDPFEHAIFATPSGRRIIVSRVCEHCGWVR
jgi:hypothetical protein